MTNKPVYFPFLESKGLFDDNVRDDYLKPGFEEGLSKNTTENRPSLDVDLDGEIYADQLHTLLQRTSPELSKTIKSFEEKKPFAIDAPYKLTDEEKVWNGIHGNAGEDAPAAKPSDRYKPPLQIPHRGGVFEGAFQGPKFFRQSIMIRTIRKPDGTYEIRRTVTGNDGIAKTTVTNSNGHTETIVHDNGMKKQLDEGAKPAADDNMKSILDMGRNLYVSKDGYALPRNLWWLEISMSSIILCIYSIIVVVTFMCLSKYINLLYSSKVVNRKSIMHKKKSYIVITQHSWNIFFLIFYFHFDFKYEFR